MKLPALLTLVAMSVIAGLAMTSQAAVKDTKHNMNNVFGVGTVQNNEVCTPCHAPHNQPQGASAAVGTLWNHVMPTETYTLWTSANAENATIAGLDSTSLKCLSCHDGTVAVDSYGGYTFGNKGSAAALTGSAFGPSTGTHKLGSSNDIWGGSTAGFVVGANGDLSHDHPVGVVYPASGYNNPANWTKTGYTNTSGVVVSYLTATGATGASTTGGGLTLEGGNVAGVGVVGCGTCHTPHGDTYNFLVIDNYGSQLCMSCHTR